MVENAVLKSCIPTIVDSITSRWCWIAAFLTPSNSVAVCAATCLRLILSNWPSAVVLSSSKDIIQGLSVLPFSHLHSRKASNATPARYAPSPATPSPSVRPPTPPSRISIPSLSSHPQSSLLSFYPHSGQASLAVRRFSPSSPLLELTQLFTAPLLPFYSSPLQARNRFQSPHSRGECSVTVHVQTYVKSFHSRG